MCGRFVQRYGWHEVQDLSLSLGGLARRGGWLKSPRRPANEARAGQFPVTSETRLKVRR